MLQKTMTPLSFLILTMRFLATNSVMAIRLLTGGLVLCLLTFESNASTKPEGSKPFLFDKTPYCRQCSYKENLKNVLHFHTLTQRELAKTLKKQVLTKYRLEEAFLKKLAKLEGELRALLEKDDLNAEDSIEEKLSEAERALAKSSGKAAKLAVDEVVGSLDGKMTKSKRGTKAAIAYTEALRAYLSAISAAGELSDDRVEQVNNIQREVASTKQLVSKYEKEIEDLTSWAEFLGVVQHVEKIQREVSSTKRVVSRFEKDIKELAVWADFLGVTGGKYSSMLTINYHPAFIEDFEPVRTHDGYISLDPMAHLNRERYMNPNITMSPTLTSSSPTNAPKSGKSGKSRSNNLGTEGDRGDGRHGTGAKDEGGDSGSNGDRKGFGSFDLRGAGGGASIDAGGFEGEPDCC